MRVFYRIVFFLITICNINYSYAQGGDQILDGIGETSLVARYVFNGDLKDWSRNNFHGIYKGGIPSYQNDVKFGKVLSLSGSSNDFVVLPKDILSNIESLSISVWVNLRSALLNQYIFDFGKNNGSVFSFSPAGVNVGDVGESSILNVKSNSFYKSICPILSFNTWEHLVIIVDASSKTMLTYINNKKVAEVNNIDVNLSQIFDGKYSNDFIVNVGNNVSVRGVGLDALLHDFRIYRVPLSAKQVEGIYTNKTKVVSHDIGKTEKSEDNLQEFSLTQSQLYNAYLLSVDDVNITTQLGELPRLPSYVTGIYKDKMVGPKVRVIWPSPIDNSEVLATGKYTITGKIPGTDLQAKAYITIKKGKKSIKHPAQLESFPLNRVSLELRTDLKESKFIENRNKFINVLAMSDPNSFLYMFRNAFGQIQPEGAVALGVWDSQDTKLRGHATGHYLTAIAQAYASTEHDKAIQENFASKINYIIDELYRLAQLSGKGDNVNKGNTNPLTVPVGAGKSVYNSDLSVEGIRTDYWNWGKGFISAYPPDQFIMLELGAKYGGQKNQIWAPYYTLHKLLAGLIDVYKVTGNKKALEIAVGMSDWVYERLNSLPKETLISMWNTYIAGEFGGMNETLATLSKLTNNPKYLQAAQLFDNIDMFFGNSARTHGLAKNVDTFRGLHANQHIPQIVGSIEIYGVSDLDEYYQVADNFWYKAVNDYTYSIGGVAGARNPANAECFISEPATIYENGFSAGGQNETCATYNMLKLTTNLFMYDQKAEYMDYYERGLYNHILASVDKNTPANTYHVSLRPGTFKQFGNPTMTGFTCCNGTAIESSTKLQNAIYFKSKDDKSLYVNLFIPSILNWEERNVIVEQKTSFPNADETKLIINGEGKFDIHIRVPNWAKKGFLVKINGKVENVNAIPGTYLKLSKIWRKGDVIDLKIPFGFYLNSVMDQQNIASLFYGPILLAAQEPEAMSEWRTISLEANDISKSIKGDASKLEFMIGDIVFKPFYDTYGRHSVYFNVELQ